jgi:hypothetical protein
MARRESYNPLLKSYPDSERVNALSIGAETLYTRLIAASDDAGRYYGDAKWVLARLFTARMVAGQVTPKDVEGWLSELENVGLAVRYIVADAKYIELLDVYKCIRKDVKAQVIYPERLPESVTDTLRMRNGHGPLDLEPTQPITNLDPTNICPETAVAVIETAVLTFPTDGNPREWDLTDAKVKEFREAFPSLDVVAECRKALAWVQANPTKRKTPRGMPGFLFRWLSRVQDRGGMATTAAKPALFRFGEGT